MDPVTYEFTFEPDPEQKFLFNSLWKENHGIFLDLNSNTLIWGQ